jgi:hypothetical protein
MRPGNQPNRRRRRAERRAENPVDENNHALAALRYLISRLDARHMVKRPPDERYLAPRPSRPSIDEDDERWWIPLN